MRRARGSSHLTVAGSDPVVPAAPIEEISKEVSFEQFQTVKRDRDDEPLDTPIDGFPEVLISDEEFSSMIGTFDCDESVYGIA